MLASFVPRPVLQDETVEDQQNVIEEMVDEKVECNDDDGDDEELEGFSTEGITAERIPVTDSGSLYSVHPSGELTLVFRNSPQPGCSPALSPALPSADFKPSSDTVRDVRVKLERCDDSDFSAETPPKRSRIEADVPLAFSSHGVPLQRLNSEMKSEAALSEADAAVAGLLGSSSVSDGEILTNEAASNCGQLSDGLDVCFADGVSERYSPPSAMEFDLNESAERFAENGMVVTNPSECDMTANNSGTMTQIGAYDGETVTAVDSLMADLVQLNAEMPNTVRTFIPNGSVYLPSPVTKLSLAKRTSDVSAAITGSFDDASLMVTEAVECDQQPSHIDSYSLMHSSAFSNGTKFDHEPDLDAAIKSILS